MSYSKIIKGKLYRSNHGTVFEDEIMLLSDKPKKMHFTNRFMLETKQEDIDDISEYKNYEI